MASTVGINPITPTSSGTTGQSGGLSGSPNSGLLSSPGIGSGLNVQQIVSALVAADQAPEQDQIDNQLAEVQAQTSALGTLKSSLSALETSLASLANGSAFTGLTATSSNTSLFTATAASSATPGVYQVEVNQTAAAQQATSAAFASGADVGTGTLTLTVGGESVNVQIASGADTLADISAAINSASGNPGVSATVIQAADGDHLVLTSAQTGTANAFSVSASGGNGGLSALTWNAPTGSGSMALQTAAADAQISVDGLTVSSPTDVIDNAVTGVTLNVVGAKAGQAETLTVGNDTTSMVNAVQQFVSAYNSFVTGAASLASYDPSTQTAGPLLGSAMLMTVQSQLATVISGLGGSSDASLNTLGAAGISLQSDGTLELDTTTLQNAFEQNPEQVANLFSAGQGYATELNGLVQGYLAPGGLLDTQSQSLSEESTSLNQQQTALNTRMQAVQQRYMQEYSALDTTMSQMNETSSFLSTQLQSLMSMYEPSSGSSSGSSPGSA